MSTTDETIIDARLLKRLPAERDSAGFTLDFHLQGDAGITVLLGSSGAGKSLTLNCIAGFARPDEGRILVHNEIYFDAATKVHVPPERRRCGYIFQDHALFPHMTLRENLRFAASVATLEKANRLNRHARVNELMELFELNVLANRKPGQLSGGQRQRAALARVLAGEPRVLLLDEPTRGLDTRLRSSFYEVLRQTHGRLRVPVLLVTHDLDECFELADSVYLMENGRCLQSGSRETVFARPVSVEVARMLGIQNIIPAEIAALDPGRRTSRIAALNAVLEGPYFPAHLIGDRGSICIRDHEVKVRSAKIPDSVNQISLRIESITPVPSGMRFCFEHQLCAVISETDARDLRGEEQVWVEIPPSAIHFIG